MGRGSNQQLGAWKGLTRGSKQLREETAERDLVKAAAQHLGPEEPFPNIVAFLSSFRNTSGGASVTALSRWPVTLHRDSVNTHRRRSGRPPSHTAEPRAKD